MRRHIATLRAEEDENEINLTPMLDVVFIMLIFFIVTATFIRETGLDVQRPDQNENIPVVKEDGAILVIIDNNDDIWIDGAIVDERAVRAHIERLHAENADRPVVIQAERTSTTKTLVAVMDASHQADVYNVSIVSGG
jgi:biopolymer transport protein ExbD